MPKPENAGKSADAKGQTKDKTFVAPDGTQLVSNQAEYKKTLKAEGYTPLDDDGDDESEITEPPAVTPAAPVVPVG